MSPRLKPEQFYELGRQLGRVSFPKVDIHPNMSEHAITMPHLAFTKVRLEPAYYDIELLGRKLRLQAKQDNIARQKSVSKKMIQEAQHEEQALAREESEKLAASTKATEACVKKLERAGFRVWRGQDEQGNLRYEISHEVLAESTGHLLEALKILPRIPQRRHLNSKWAHFIHGLMEPFVQKQAD